MWTRGLLLLAGGLCASCEPQTEKEKVDFGFVPAGVYETLDHYEPGPIGILFHLVHALLCVVQPNAFPQDLIAKLVKEKFGASHTEYQKPENIVLTLQVLYYELGFLLCAGVGVVFLLLLPLAGLLLCVCRCCDNCGGEMHQRQRKNADCQRGLLGTLLFTTSLVITLGVLCAYAANQTLSSQVKNVRRLVNSNMRDLHTFVNDTPTQIDYLISQYSTAKGKVLYDLNNIGPLLGGGIHGQLTKEVRPAMDMALSLAGVKIERALKAMRETRDALENASVSLEVLQEGSGKLAFSLSLTRNSLNRTLFEDPACRDPQNQPTSAQLCSSIQMSLSRLDLHANYSRLSSVNPQLEKMNQVLQVDLIAIIHRGHSSLNNTPSLVGQQTVAVVEAVRGMLDHIGSNISSFSKGFPVQSVLANLTILINHAHSSIEDHYPLLDQMDFYRWAGCVALCCMLVLVLTFNFLGLLCGTLGYDKQASPTTRGCISNTGGTLLMAGVGFSFLFSWILMGTVTAAFLVGGNLEKLICESYRTKELFQVVDTPYMVKPEWRRFIPGFLYNDSELELTAENLYSNCKENRGIYSAARLDKIFNITAFLNTSLLTREVVAVLGGVRVDLGEVVLMQPEGKQNLLDFSETGLSEINYAQYLEEVNKGVTVEDLLSFSSLLETQAELMTEGPLQTALRGHASTLRQIHGQQVVPLEQAMKYVRARGALNQSMRFLERTASDLPNKVLAVLNAIDEAQYLISQNATHLINQETQKYTEAIVGYFHQYTDWVATAMALEVAPCRPLSNMADTAHILTCCFLLDSMNTFWMGLGCSSVFLLPSIVLAVKLAKFYRRMETEDVYDDAVTVPMKTIPTYDTMTRFPRASAPPSHIDW